jgi:hypothetical protein
LGTRTQTSYKILSKVSEQKNNETKMNQGSAIHTPEKKPETSYKNDYISDSTMTSKKSLQYVQRTKENHSQRRKE